MKKRENSNWKTFDAYAKDASSIWSIELNQENWKLGKCSCPYFIKNYMCKHLIGISARCKLVGCQIPLIAKQVPLGQKRKRGAPSKAKKALIVQ